MTDLLVIGYGNELRGDDGVGPAVARAVAARGRPGVKALAVRQLLPEHAPEVAAAGRVVFVDARVGGGPPRLEPISGGGQLGIGHISDPKWLLAVVDALYGVRPQAWLLTVGAAAVGHGARLTPAARRGVAAARALLARLEG